MPQPRRQMGLTDPVILVKVLGEADGVDSWNPTSASTVRCLLCGMPNDLEDLSVQVVKQTLLPVNGKSDRRITVANPRQNIPLVGHHYLAYRFGQGYIIDNQAVFSEYFVSDGT